MNNIKVSILGADGYVCQIPRIKEGMEALGHIVTNVSPDLIYSNDPRGYNEALSLKKRYPSAYLILNFLDIPWHFPNIQKQTELLAKNYFSKADVLTTISFKVQKDLAKFYDKIIHVIYNPIKDVYLDEKIKKNNTFFYVGRVFDPVKRFSLVRETRPYRDRYVEDAGGAGRAVFRCRTAGSDSKSPAGVLVACAEAGGALDALAGDLFHNSLLVKSMAYNKKRLQTRSI